MEKYDIVIFGASGYTGQYVVEEAYRQMKNTTFSLAVAGRSREKVFKVLQNSANNCDDQIVNIPIIVADVSDPNSLDEMAKRAKVVLNCVGPYRFYGEQVVKACVANGTHHFDISGEPQYLESMQLLYHTEAERNGCYVVGACGFDSIPAEMGIKFVTDLFSGNVNDVEAYLKNKADKDMKIHFGTWESAVYGFANRGELSGLRKKLFPQRIPKAKYPALKRSLMFYSNDINRWCLPFPGSDKSVAVRSQSFLHFQKNKRAVQFNPYLSIPSLLAGIFTIFVGGIFGLFSSFAFGRKLLLKYPQLFSLGLVSREGASRKAVENTKMELIFIGRGWTEGDLVDTVKPNRKVICSVSGPEPGYVSCSICLVQAALTTLKETDKMPGRGGVYAPLAAFNETSYLSRLEANGIHFNKISDISL